MHKYLVLSLSFLESTDAVCPAPALPWVLCAPLTPVASGAPMDAPVGPHRTAQPGSSQCQQGDRDPVPVNPTSFLPGCCRQWYQDPVATHRGPCQLSPQAHWQQACRSHRGGSACRRCPQPLTPQRQRQQQQRQPPSLPPSPLRQRLGPVRGAQKGSPATAAVHMGPASAPQHTSSPTAVSAAASSGPALPSAAGALLEPSEPTEARPLPAPAACGSFTSYSPGAQPRPSFRGCLASAWAFCSLAGTLGLSSLHTQLWPPHQEGRILTLGSLPQLLGSLTSRPGLCSVPLPHPFAGALLLLSLFLALPPLAHKAREDKRLG